MPQLRLEQVDHTSKKPKALNQTLPGNLEGVAWPRLECLALGPMGAGFSVDAPVRQAQAFDGPAMNQVLLDDLGGIFRLHMAVPDRIRVDHNRGAVLALIKAAGFVDAHLGAQPGGLG
jgi:hypothetical protein